MRSKWLDIGQVIFLRVYGPRPSRGPQTHKNSMGQISSHLGQTSLVNKGFIIWLQVKFLMRDTVGSPEQDSSILPARVANHSVRFGSFRRLTELAML